MGLDLAAASRRSIVAALIDTSRAAASSSMPNSPKRRTTRTISDSSGTSRLPAGALATAQHFSRAATTSASYFGDRRARAVTTRGVIASLRA